MFNKKPDIKENKAEKLSGPGDIPELVKKHLIDDKKLPESYSRFLKSVVRKMSAEGKEKAYSIRIFDPGDANAKRIDVKNYLSLDEHPDMILYEGWYNDSEKKVELLEKRSPLQGTKILSYEEILKGIESLTQPGSTFVVFISRGPTSGGPLGKGCAIAKLNDPAEGKKIKKYTLYTADVVDNQPVDKGQKLMDSDKAKDVAKQIKDWHSERTY